jgi:hypothetical protein
VNVDRFAGKKIVRPKNKKFMMVPNEYRKLHKHFYQVTENGKLKMALGDWSTTVQ